MNEKRYTLLALGGCAALFLGSFTDESAQIILALRLENARSVSALFAAALGGGILASTFSPWTFQRFGPARTIVIALVLQSAIIAFASQSNHVLGYLVSAGALGYTGSIFWSAIMVAGPGIARSEIEIERMNRVIQTVRSLGYVAGPLLGSALYGETGGRQALLLLALVVLTAAMISTLCLRIFNSTRESCDPPTPENLRAKMDFKGLICTKGVARALFPLVVTVIVTSALNVLLLVRIRRDLNFDAQVYGVVVSALSLGLVLAPFTLTRLFGRVGDAAGASAAASLIGAGICWLALGNAIWSITLSSFVIGSANGIQNTLMANFMMKRIEKKQRVNQMPVYVLILQISVVIGFAGAGFMGGAGRMEGCLLVIGIIALIVGMCGFFINFGDRKILQPADSRRAEPR